MGLSTEGRVRCAFIQAQWRGTCKRQPLIQESLRQTAELFCQRLFNIEHTFSKKFGRSLHGLENPAHGAAGFSCSEELLAALTAWAAATQYCHRASRWSARRRGFLFLGRLSLTTAGEETPSQSRPQGWGDFFGSCNKPGPGVSCALSTWRRGNCNTISPVLWLAARDRRRRDPYARRAADQNHDRANVTIVLQFLRHVPLLRAGSEIILAQGKENPPVS